MNLKFPFISSSFLLAIISITILFTSCLEENKDDPVNNNNPSAFDLIFVNDNADEIILSPYLTWEMSTDPDGDKVFATWKGSGNLGKDAKGTYTYVGGTGKYEGITGGGEFTRSGLQPPSKGVWAAITLFKGNWKLP